MTALRPKVVSLKQDFVFCIVDRGTVIVYQLGRFTNPTKSYFRTQHSEQMFSIKNNKNKDDSKNKPDVVLGGSTWNSTVEFPKAFRIRQVQVPQSESDLRARLTLTKNLQLFISYRDADMFAIVAREFKPMCVQERVSSGYVISLKPNSTTDPGMATIRPPGGYVELPVRRRGESGRHAIETSHR